MLMVTVSDTACSKRWQRLANEYGIVQIVLACAEQMTPSRRISGLMSSTPYLGGAKHRLVEPKNVPNGRQTPDLIG